MKTQVLDAIELVFKHNNQQYVIEYDLTIDGEDAYTDITRVECYGATSLTPGAVAHGMALVEADASVRYAEHIEDKVANDMDYMRD